MGLEVLVFVLVVVAAIPATLFPFAYAWIARGVWHRTPTGRALMISSTALAALLDSELLLEVLPVSRPVESGVALVIVTLIAMGAWLKFGALLHEAGVARRLLHADPCTVCGSLDHDAREHIPLP